MKILRLLDKRQLEPLLPEILMIFGQIIKIADIPLSPSQYLRVLEEEISDPDMGVWVVLDDALGLKLMAVVHINRFKFAIAHAVVVLLWASPDFRKTAQPTYDEVEKLMCEFGVSRGAQVIRGKSRRLRSALERYSKRWGYKAVATEFEKPLPLTINQPIVK